jgi:hypothetical protein
MQGDQKAAVKIHSSQHGVSAGFYKAFLRKTKLSRKAIRAQQSTEWIIFTEELDSGFQRSKD